jgi:hypothetical protein
VNDPDSCPGDEVVADWFASRLPAGWSVGVPEVMSDHDEILVILEPRDAPTPVGVERFRRMTREHRMNLAEQAEAVFARKVAWGVRSGGEVHLFTTASVPVMTRLRLPERRILDTLIDAGVARSRSDALAWCVRLVGSNERTWIAELRAAFHAVEAVRAEGPHSTRQPPG